MRYCSLILLLFCAIHAIAGKTKFTIIQMNDVYEMKPLSDDRGGLARVATLKKQLQERNPDTFAVLAGDMLSPSAIGGAKIDGQSLAGMQMISVMNHILDYMTFGNHEFDIKEEQLKTALKQSQFTWVSSNIFDVNNRSFPWVLPNVVFEVGKEKVKVGIFGVTLKMTNKDWVHYRDEIEMAKEQVKILREQKGVQVVIALTHLALPDDKKLREQVPGIDLILGGHEHNQQYVPKTDKYPPIYKADANARTVYVHHLTYDTEKKKLGLDAELVNIDSSIRDDRRVAELIERWEHTALSSLGIDRSLTVATTTEDLDGRDSEVRNGQTNLTQILADSVLNNSKKKVDASFYNSGSIRIDDIIPAQMPMSEYDVLRILPFGGNFVHIRIRGDLLIKVLDQGIANIGKGGYLQWGNIEKKDQWTIKGQAIKASQTYDLAISDYLLTGLEEGLAELKCFDEEGTCLEECLEDGLTCVERMETMRELLTAELIRVFK